MRIIYHLAVRGDWEAARAPGAYSAPTLATEGFCHCSGREQVIRSADRYFRGRTDLVLLAIRVDLLASRLLDEDTSGRGEVFPHVYGPIGLAAILAAVPLQPGPDGAFDFPAQALRAMDWPGPAA